MIGIIDYGAGNLHSVQKAFSFLGKPVKLIQSSENLNDCSRMVLPGVGHFGSAMNKLRLSNLIPAIIQWIQTGKPFLGICLGLQLLFKNSEESHEINGLGIIQGSVKRFESLKIPQIGWNQVVYKSSALFESIPQQSYFYFLHSYYVKPVNSIDTIGTTQYDIEYTSAIHYQNIWAVQFHPEKSGDLGLKLLSNWSDLC